MGSVSAINPQFPANMTGVTTETSVGIASAQLTPANFAQRFLIIQNIDATDMVYLSFTNPATANDIQLGPGASIDFNPAVPVNAIYAVSSANTPKVAIISG